MDKYLTIKQTAILLGMSKNHRLARAILDVGFYEFKRQLEYKAEWKRNKIKVHDRFYPSTKKCSSCGKVKKEMSLSTRVYRCKCGLVMDRDLNSSINLSVRPVRSELTPEEITALNKQAGIVCSTNIEETGNKHLSYASSFE